MKNEKGDVVIDGWIFEGSENVCDVWVRGVKKVEGGSKRLREEEESDLKKELGELIEWKEKEWMEKIR